MRVVINCKCGNKENAMHKRAVNNGRSVLNIEEVVDDQGDGNQIVGTCCKGE
jgi:hypothetical protein